MPDILTALTINMMILLSPLGQQQLSASLDPVLLDKAQHIDVISVAGKFSYAEYHKCGGLARERTGFPRHSLAPPAIPFGDCLPKNGRLVGKTGAACGYVIPLGRGPAALNLLGYDELEISGRFSGTWKIAFADDPLAAVQDNVQFGTLSESGSKRFALKDLLLRADLSRSRQLVLLLASKSGAAHVDRVTFSHRPVSARETLRGIWIWRRDSVLGREDAVVKRLTAKGVQRTYLQVGDDPEVFAPFLGRAARAGIEVYALDGSPGYATAPQELLERMARVERYNRTHAGALYAGFQIDVEPYLSKDFASRKSFYAAAYLEMLDRLKAGSSLPLSVVVPFWFDTLHAQGKSLLQCVFDHADEVVVMSYRTDPQAVLDISRSALSLGENLGKPVLLGVELGPIPDEQHQEYDRCQASSAGALRLGSAWWCRGNEYLVAGSRISFKTRMQELPSFLRTSIPFSSFNGWVLHSYEEIAQNE